MPEHFTVSEVASGVYACVAGASQAAVGNTAIVDTGSRTIVVDSFMTTVGAAELRLAGSWCSGRGDSVRVGAHDLATRLADAEARAARAEATLEQT